MKNKIIYNKIIKLKEYLICEGFVIDGVFGSYARDEETDKSDVDILYHLEDKFYEKYSGFTGFQKLDDIKKIISNKLEKKIDLAPKTNLSKTAQKYILKDIIYV